MAFVTLVGLLRPRWVVWENVPGVFSADCGSAFGSLLSGLGNVGYGWAYRVLDAQYFGVAQQRERVFVVGHSGGDWRRSAAVLFEPEGVRWDSPPRREARGETAGVATSGLDGGCLARSMNAHSGRFDPETETLIAQTLRARTGSSHRADGETFVPAVAHSLRAEGHDASEDGTGRGSPLVSAALASGVRRLTPREMERLQGFPDDFTRIPWRGKGEDDCPDGPRAKALGNSMAVPVLRWLGRRIRMVEAIP